MGKTLAIFAPSPVITVFKGAMVTPFPGSHGYDIVLQSDYSEEIIDIPIEYGFPIDIPWIVPLMNISIPFFTGISY